MLVVILFQFIHHVYQRRYHVIYLHLDLGLNGHQKNSTHIFFIHFAGKKVSEERIKIILMKYFYILDPESKTGVLLIALIIPGHLIFFFIIYFISDYFGDLQPDLTIWFVLFYLMAAVVQVNNIINND